MGKYGTTLENWRVNVQKDVEKQLEGFRCGKAIGKATFTVYRNGGPPNDIWLRFALILFGQIPTD
jgi:hypothetical protein